MEPAGYEAWYHTRRGHWIAEREFALALRMLRPAAGESLLDVGTGTGHFARRFAAAGLQVSGIDPDAAALAYARCLQGGIAYLEGDARALPFPDRSFDHCAAITSLCFIPEPERALAEMWRVCRRGVFLGLLNRRSLLHRQTAGRGGYRGARWDGAGEVISWAGELEPTPRITVASALFLPGGGPVARLTERLIPSGLPLGGFLAASLSRPL